MIVLSTIEDLSSKIKEELIRDFESVEFKFCKGMDEGQRFLEVAEILITYGNDLTSSLIQSAGNLKWVMVMSAGLDNMPVDEIVKRNIVVTNVRGIHKIPMAEYTLSMMLNIARNTKQVVENEYQAEWDQNIPLLELHNRAVAIVGTGAIGQEVARLAKAFQMKTIGFNTSGKKVNDIDHVFSIDKLRDKCKKVDYIVSVLPSTQETQGIYDYSFFKMLKKEACFINIGRGDAVVERDLIRALNEQHFAHAVLDVFVEEPLPSKHPFWQMNNVTVTPHLAALSPEYLVRATTIFINNLTSYLKGDLQMKNIVDLNRGY